MYVHTYAYMDICTYTCIHIYIWLFYDEIYKLSSTAGFFHLLLKCSYDALNKSDAVLNLATQRIKTLDLKDAGLVKLEHLNK